MKWQMSNIKAQTKSRPQGLFDIWILKFGFYAIVGLLWSIILLNPSFATTVKNTPKGPVQVTNIRHWSNPSYTRVVIDLTGEATFKHHLLREDPELKKPRRLYIDLTRATLSPGLKQPIPIHDGLLRTARAGQHTKEMVRVVLDIDSIEDYKVFPLEGPFRVVIDVKGKREVSVVSGQWSEKEAKEAEPTLAQQLGLKIKTIVVDPGHGGKDPGAIGKRGLQEKDVTLKIARGLREALVREVKANISLTRDDDTFIPLEERTAIANTMGADLFISIHVNSSYNRAANGVETYYLSLTTDEEAIRVAARENAVSTKKMSDLQYILNDLMRTAKVNESSLLATHIQDSLTSTLNARYKDVRGNGVKQAPFYVLVGAQMPCVLVEVSFISNPEEEARLRDDAYIREIVDGITAGVKGYMQRMGSAGG